MEGSIFVLLLSAITFVNGQNICPKVAPCHCYEHTKQIRCENIREVDLNDDKLTSVFTSLTGDFNILYLYKTDIKIIKAGTFKGMKFQKIFIVDNSLLADIDVNAFNPSDTTTTALVIRNNPSLTHGDHLFEIAGKFVGLKNVEFDMNKIATIPTGAFAGTTTPTAKFQSLERIRLDSQHGEITNIAANSFKMLPKLLQLSLDSNQIKYTSIQKDAIDLTDRTAGHVAIFLNKNNLDDITIEQIKVTDAADKVSLSLDLEGNAIKKLKDGLFDIILKNQNGRVFLSNNPIACQCNEVAKIKVSQNLNNIHGLPQSFQCSIDNTPNGAKLEITKCT